MVTRSLAAWMAPSSGPSPVNTPASSFAVESDNSNSLLQIKDKFYLLALGFYKTEFYTKSREHLEIPLQIQPDWRQARALRTLRTRRKEDGVIGMAIATGVIGVLGFVTGGVMFAIGAVGLAASGLIAAASSSSSRKKE